MRDRARIIGTYISPYVRKVLVTLELKGVPYEIDPIIPFMGNDAFSKLSPVRRIPVLVDDLVSIADSSVICAYLEERYPEPPIYPRAIADRARARWLEEFADTRMGEVFIWRLFNQRVINPFVWGKETDQAIVEQALTRDIPDVLDYLEGELPERGFLFADVSIADIAIASFFRNAAFARFEVDAGRWPRTAAFVARVLGLESFRKLKAFEDLLARTPIPRHRSVLAEHGAPLTRETYATDTPRPGILSI